MNSLALHIEYLLLRHDCVVVPGLGAFLAHTGEAWLDEATSTMHPPVRHLGFNADVRLNDGLLAQSVARREHITIEMANRQIASDVGAFTRRLAVCGALEVGRLGRMSLDGETLMFSPATESVITLPFRGLRSFRMEPLPSENAEETAEGQTEWSADTAPHFPVWLKVAASIMVAFVSMGLLFSTTNLADRSGVEQASLDSGLRKSVERMTDGSGDMIALSREIMLNIARPQQPSEVAPAVRTVPQRYLLVVGSFPSQRQAERFIAGESGLRYLEMDGNFRVYAASAPTIIKANSLADSLRTAYPNVWVCRK